MTEKRGLGRGLGALIPSAGGVDEVDIDLVAPNPEQPRLGMAPEALEELAASVREHGLLQPLVVTRLVSDSGAVSYQLIAGERRLRAARQAGLTKVPVVVRETTPRGMLELALVENLQRADLGPLEEARAFRRLADDFGLTQEEISARIGRSRTAVANTLRLLTLPDTIKDGLTTGRITEGHARALLGLPDDPARLALYAEVLARGLSVRETEELVRRLRESSLDAAATKPATSPARERSRDPDLAAIEERLRASLGTQVRLERGRKGGRIVIQFYGDEDLEGLIARLLGEEEER
jgi:ParB family transcriptional regulator, chromosome partitioning protein